MYQDSGCNSSTRRGSAAAAAAAALTAAEAAAVEAAAEKLLAAATPSDEELLQALTIITTTTITTTASAAAATADIGVAETTTTTTTVITAAAAGSSNTVTTPTAAATATQVTPKALPSAHANTFSNSSTRNSSNSSDDDIYTDANFDIDCIASGSANVHPTSISRSNSCGNAAAFHQQPNEQQQQQAQRLSALNADVRLLRTIGYIASRVRCLAKYYGDFHLHNPYSARRQRRQLQEILLKHSIFDPGRERERALLLAAAAVAVGAAATLTTTTLTTTVTRSQSCGSNLGIASCVEQPIDQQQQHRQVLLLNVDSDDEEQQQVQEEELELLIAITTATAATTTATTTNTAATIVRRNKSSNSSASVSAIASAEASGSGSGSGLSSSSDSLAIAATPIALLEELLIQFYEDQDQEQNSSKLTVIRQQLAARSDNLNNNNNGRGSGSNNNNNNNIQEEENGSSRSASTHSLTMSASHSNNMVETTTVATTTTTATATIAVDAPSSSSSRAFLLQPAQDPDTPRRRRASDCSAVQAANQQLHITLKNNNCANKLHRGSCGGAGEHLLAANSIANRATIILSKSCSNVDGDATASLNLSLSSDAGGVAGLNLQLRASATDLESNSNGGGGGGAAAAALNGAREAITSIAAAASNGNGNNEYSILQLNNTIIQCHFNDDDFRALVKDLKRKVEYTERMNWLCLSNRPLGPPHRKSSLPKHQEVKRRFLEICDTNFSDEVKSALRLPAFDSYEWGDADVIHLMQTMFLELGFIEKFSIPVETLREWLYEVYKHYNEVPFHNFRHCFCVAQMMYAITRQANLLHRLGDLECLILLVSCICHDLDHPGYNNIYQINARTELALRYNDISPLENHHCSIAFRLLEHPECNIFKNFGRETFNTIREGIIRCILATDMARHNEILTQFIEITPVFDYNNRAHINLLCMILIKVADISNEARPMDVAEPWLDRLLQEFFAQSAAEKSEGLPVTPFMDPDKVSKPGSQVRFIGLVLLPLFEALGELVPELTELIIIPVRIALEYYRRLNDAQTKTRKSVADSATSDSNSGNMDSNAALIGTSMQSTSAAAAAGGGGASCSAGGSGGSGGAGAAGGGSPQMPRSGSGISVKSRRSAPTQKSASRTSMDEPSGMAAELHDLPEGSESGDSETATEVDVAEKTSKFKVDTEGCSNRSKSSHSNSRKSSREKRPSMIGELCSSGGGQRIRNSYGNIHGHGHPNRCHFGSNRAVSLDQYSSNNRRLSDGLPQVISDSNVFYGRGHGHGAGAGGSRQHEDHNMNTSNSNSNSNSNSASFTVIQQQPMQLAAHPVAQLMLQQQQQQQPQVVVAATTNGNVSPTLTLTQLQSQMSQPASNGSARSSAGTVSVAAAAAAAANVASGSGGGGWKSRLRQFSDYFSFSFDKNNKRFGSTRSSPCSQRGGNNNGGQAGQAETSAQALAQAQPVGASAATAPCCTISNNMQSGSASGGGQSVSRHRAYSLDVPCARHAATRYSSGDSSSRSHTQHSNHDSYSNSSTGGGNGASVGGGGGGVADLSGIRIRVAEAAGIGMSGVTTAMLQEERARLAPSVSCELGLASVSSSEAVPKI